MRRHFRFILFVSGSGVPACQFEWCDADSILGKNLVMVLQKDALLRSRRETDLYRSLGIQSGETGRDLAAERRRSTRAQ